MGMPGSENSIVSRDVSSGNKGFALLAKDMATNYDYNVVVVL